MGGCREYGKKRLMSILDLLWGKTSPHGNSHKVFTTKKQIHQELFKLKTLNQNQRQEIFDLIEPELDEGGVTSREGLSHLNHKFYELYQRGEISKIDYEYLKGLWSD